MSGGPTRSHIFVRRRVRLRRRKSSRALIFRAGRASIEWPGQDLAILVLLAVWFLVSRVFIAVLRVPAPPATAAPSDATTTGR